MRNSPFVGVFARVTDGFVLVPKQAQKKEIDGLRDFFGVEVVHTNIANSSLIGILSIANSHGIILPGLAEEHEVKQLEQAGLRVKKLHAISAFGNLVALNDRVGICSKHISKETKKEMESFLKVELKQMQVGGSDLAGAAVVATNNGFVTHAKTDKKELDALEKIFGVKGRATSANYGDAFVAHGVAANSRAALVGVHSTQHEMMRIDEGLSGE